MPRLPCQSGWEPPRTALRAESLHVEVCSIRAWALVSQAGLQLITLTLLEWILSVAETMPLIHTGAPDTACPTSTELGWPHALESGRENSVCVCARVCVASEATSTGPLKTSEVTLTCLTCLTCHGHLGAALLSLCCSQGRRLSTGGQPVR